jgi:hypothetical protein
MKNSDIHVLYIDDELFTLIKSDKCSTQFIQLHKNHFNNYKINDYVKLLNDTHKDTFIIIKIININITNRDDNYTRSSLFTRKEIRKHGLFEITFEFCNYKLILEDDVDNSEHFVSYISSINEAYDLVEHIHNIQISYRQNTFNKYNVLSIFNYEGRNMEYILCDITNPQSLFYEDEVVHID